MSKKVTRYRVLQPIWHFPDVAIQRRRAKGDKRPEDSRYLVRLPAGTEVDTLWPGSVPRLLRDRYIEEIAEPEPEPAAPGDEDGGT